MPASKAIDPVARPEGSERSEPYLHFLVREGQLILRILLLMSVAATVGLMVTIFYLAIIPAIFAIVFLVLLLVANRAEESTRDPESPAPRDWAEGPFPGEPVATTAEEAEDAEERVRKNDRAQTSEKN